MPECHVCGRSGQHTTTVVDVLSETFTNYSMCRAPWSSVVCDRCRWVFKDKVWYYNARQSKWSKLFVRGLTCLYLGDQLVYPKIEGEREGWPIATELASRGVLRHWLLNPPNPPFTIAIAESGQKYVLPWAQEAQDRHYFPVQFELDTVWIQPKEFATLLEAIAHLLTAFTKTEIATGQPKSQSLLSNLPLWLEHSPVIEQYRGSRLLELALYL